MSSRASDLWDTFKYIHVLHPLFRSEFDSTKPGDVHTKTDSLQGGILMVTVTMGKIGPASTRQKEVSAHTRLITR